MPVFDRSLNEVLPDNYPEYFNKEMFIPAFPLTNFIENYIVLSNNKLFDNSDWFILPDTRSYLICYQYNNAYRSGWKVVFVGPRSKGIEIKQVSRRTTLIVPFKLCGTYPFLKLPVSEFANQGIDLSFVWAHKIALFTESLNLCSNSSQYIRALEKFLIDIFGVNVSVNPVMQGVIDMIATGNNALKVKDLAIKTGFSERHLLEMVKQNIGLSSKRLLLVNKLLSSLALIDKANYNVSWTNIAYQAGYYDQSNLIDDFSEMLNHSPTQFLNRYKNS